MEFSLTTLGIASATPTVSRYPSAHVLQVRGRFFLLDCGEAAQMLLKKHNFSLHKIKDIFITHLHGDHLFGLYGLLSSISLHSDKQCVNIYAPAGFAPILQSYLDNFGREINIQIKHIVVEANSPTLILDSKVVEVYAFPLKHRVECYGYLFKEKQPPLNVYKEAIEKYNLTIPEINALKNSDNPSIVRNGEVVDSQYLTYLPYKPRSFAYCTDTAYCEDLKDWLHSIDLLYHEATFLNDMSERAAETKHSTSVQSAQIASQAKVGKLVIGHFSSRYPKLEAFLDECRPIFPETYLAEEGKRWLINATL